MPYRIVERSEFAKLAPVEASGAILRKFAPVECAIEPTAQSRQFKFTFSTCNPDRDNDCVMQDGWVLDAFMSNPVALWAHSHRDLPVGKAVSCGIENGSLVGVIEFATHEFAETVYQLVKGGFLKAVSVGFRALEYAINEERRGIDFLKQELLEISIVPVPANAEALQAASLEGVDLEPIRKWMQDLIIEWPGDLKLKGAAWQKLRLGAEDKTLGKATMEINVDTKGFNDNVGVMKASLDALAAKAEDLIAKLAEATAQKSEPAKAEPTAEEASAGEENLEMADELGEPAAEASAAGDDDLTLEMSDEPEEASVSDAEFRECMSEVIGTAMAQMASEAAKSVINQMRGRLD